MSEVKSTVTAIGAKALSAKDPMVIMFDESASTELREVAVIQKFASADAQQNLVLTTGDKLMIDGHNYEITHVGQLVNEHLRTIGHVTLIFGQVDIEDLQNAIYLSEKVKPDFQIGTEIIYFHVEKR